MLEFNPEKIKQVEAEFNAKKNRGYRYNVTDPNNASKPVEIAVRRNVTIPSVAK